MIEKLKVDSKRLLSLSKRNWFYIPLIFLSIQLLFCSEEIEEEIERVYSQYQGKSEDLNHAKFSGYTFFGIFLFIFSIFYRRSNMPYLVLIGPILGGVHTLSIIVYFFFSGQIYDEGEPSYSCLSTIFFIEKAAKLLPLVGLLGRVARILPDGFESTGIALVIGLYNLCLTLEDKVSQFEMDSFGVKQGYLKRIEPCLAINLIVQIVLILFGAAFLHFKVDYSIRGIQMTNRLKSVIKLTFDKNKQKPGEVGRLERKIE